MKSFTDKTFSEEIKAGDWLVVFLATWCGPCHQLNYLDRIKNFQIGSVNIEENSSLESLYSIIVVPTYIFFRNSEPVKRLVGLQTEISLQKAYETIT